MGMKTVIVSYGHPAYIKNKYRQNYEELVHHTPLKISYIVNIVMTQSLFDELFPGTSRFVGYFDLERSDLSRLKNSSGQTKKA